MSEVLTDVQDSALIITINRPDWNAEAMWQKQSEIAARIMATNDAREGAAAFAQKRKPNWTGN